MVWSVCHHQDNHRHEHLALILVSIFSGSFCASGGLRHEFQSVTDTWAAHESSINVNARPHKLNMLRAHDVVKSTVLSANAGSEDSALSAFLARCSGPGKQVCNAAGTCTTVRKVGSLQVQFKNPNVLTMFTAGLCSSTQHFIVDFYRNQPFKYISTGGIFQLQASGHVCTEVVVHNLTTCHARRAAYTAPHFLALLADKWADTTGPGVIIGTADVGGHDPYGQAHADGSASVLRIDQDCANSLFTKLEFWQDQTFQKSALWAFMWEDVSRPGYNQSLIDCTYTRDSCSRCRLLKPPGSKVKETIDRCGPLYMGSDECPYQNESQACHRSENNKAMCLASDETQACVKKMLKSFSCDRVNLEKGDNVTEVVLDREVDDLILVNDSWPLKRGKGAPPQSNVLVLCGVDETVKAEVVDGLTRRINRSPLLAPLPVFLIDYCHSPHNVGEKMGMGAHRVPAFRWDEGEYFQNLHAMQSSWQVAAKSFSQSLGSWPAFFISLLPSAAYVVA